MRLSTFQSASAMVRGTVRTQSAPKLSANDKAAAASLILCDVNRAIRSPTLRWDAAALAVTVSDMVNLCRVDLGESRRGSALWRGSGYASPARYRQFLRSRSH